MTLTLRSAPTSLDIGEVEQMLKKYDFFDRYLNSGGKGIEHTYEVLVIKGDKIVFDVTTGLMWQQSGSLKNAEHAETQNHIVALNSGNFAGFNDWRLPTLEESMSLMEPKKSKKEGLDINPVFDLKQNWIWTADTHGVHFAWRVGFISGGYCNLSYVNGDFRYYVRAVRSR